MNKQLFNSSKEIRQDKLGRLLVYSALTVVLVLALAMLYFIFSKGIATFTQNHINFWDFLTRSNWNTDNLQKPDLGAWALMVTSAETTLLAVLVTTPLALVIAIYIVVMSPKIGGRIVQPLTELLLGIPSVVYGFVGLTLLIPFLRNWAGGTGFGVLAASLVLALMILPTITSLAVEALNGVPQSYQTFAYSLGCTKWQVIVHVLLKISAPNLLVAVIFGVARAFGEALAVQMVIGNTVQLPLGLFTPAATLTSKLTTDMGNTIDDTLASNALWSLALLLLVMSLIFNLLAKLVLRRSQSRESISR
ncbi:MAG: phosphate ABC transporter permease subunit PstC [Lactobacillus sp.]|nr:phosphate ABC transporter permease subunit PstC [Lactobacillus sp.]MDN6052583.1 phosphate ABC transporter permease subunit PstC [Lactobacillus sp.]